MKTPIKAKLGRKLSTIIGQAVAAAKRVQRMKGYKLNMSHWHTSAAEALQSLDSNPQCQVCMAGATLVCRSNVQKTDSVKLRYMLDGDRAVDPRTKTKLKAINYVRTGAVLYAMHLLRPKLKATTAQRDAINAAEVLIEKTLTARDGGRAPWHVYTKAAALLEAVGL